MFGRKKERQYMVYYDYQLDNGESGKGNVPITTRWSINKDDIKKVEKTVIERKRNQRGGGKAIVTNWKELK